MCFLLHVVASLCSTAGNSMNNHGSHHLGNVAKNASYSNTITTSHVWYSYEYNAGFAPISPHVSDRKHNTVVVLHYRTWSPFFLG